VKNWNLGFLKILRRGEYLDLRERRRRDTKENYKEALPELYSSPNTIRVIKSRTTRWAQYIARMERMRNGYTALVGKPKGRPTWEN
jgi:hypothetical protein